MTAARRPAHCARDNYLRAVRFERPDYIPMVFSINAASYQAYPQDWLLEQMERHPFLFGENLRPQLPYTPVCPPVATAGVPFADDFGCVWETAVEGLVGTVTGHPLADLDAFGCLRLSGPRPLHGHWPHRLGTGGGTAARGAGKG